MDSDKLYMNAMDDFNNDNYTDALEKFISLFNSNFDDKSIFYLILNCIELSGDDNMMDSVEKIDYDKNPSDSLFIKSFALNSIGKTEEAIQYVDEAIQLNPDNFQYHMLKMSEQVDIGKIEESENYLEDLMEKNQNVFVKIMLFNTFMETVDEDFEGDLFEIIEHIDSFEDEDIQDYLNAHGGIEGMLSELDSDNIEVEFADDNEIDGENVIQINPEDIDEDGNITIKLDGDFDLDIDDDENLSFDEDGNLVLKIDGDIDMNENNDEGDIDISFPYQFVDEEEQELTMEEIQESLTIAHSQFRYNEEHSDYMLSPEHEEYIYNNDEEIVEILENYIQNVLIYVNDFILKIDDDEMVDFLIRNNELIENRKFDEALNNTNNYFLKNPDNKNIMIYKGFLYLLNFLFIDALYIINQIEDNEKIYDCVLIKALASEALNHELSYYYFEKALEIDDNDERIWVEYIIYAINREDFNKVEQLASKCKAKFPDFEMGIED